MQIKTNLIIQKVGLNNIKCQLGQFHFSRSPDFRKNVKTLSKFCPQKLDGTDWT